MSSNIQWDKKLFGDRLKKARNNAGLTQYKLAEKAGLSQTIISGYENPKSKQGANPSIANVLLLANILGVSIDWLCGCDTQSCKKCIHYEICRKKDELPQYVCEFFKEVK